MSEKSKEVIAMARLTIVGTDYIVLDEDNVEKEREAHEGKVHLIELRFREPEERLVKRVVDLFPETRRYVISDYIRFYNLFFKGLRDKKYYVQNTVGENLFIFLKRNNKVLLNFNVMRQVERELVLEDLRTILDYVEVVKVDQEIFEDQKKVFRPWKGNVIVEGMEDAPVED